MKGATSAIAAIVGAYTPPAASELPRCGRCGEYVTLTPDAIGRLNERCPKCDRVAPRRHVNPNDALIPQTLVRPEQLLPRVRPGQLRCQRCARGVEEQARFCVDCLRAQHLLERAKLCPQCGESFVPTRYQRRCDRCETKATTRPCRSCGQPTPRRPGRPSNDCEACR